MELPTEQECRDFLACVNLGREAMGVHPLGTIDFDAATPNDGTSCLSANSVFHAAGYMVGSDALYPNENANDEVPRAMGAEPSLNDNDWLIPEEIVRVTAVFDAGHDSEGLRARMVEAGRRRGDAPLDPDASRALLRAAGALTYERRRSMSTDGQPQLLTREDAIAMLAAANDSAADAVGALSQFFGIEDDEIAQAGAIANLIDQRGEPTTRIDEPFDLPPGYVMLTFDDGFTCGIAPNGDVSS